ncbi:FYN-binding protein 1 [Tenrec ecaudatus]|uniref:FYN-binding protein 1 n=1 Tax=Tenrec ecaudatus TaxID=94439 RepID=UPI003F5A54F0
MAKFNSGGNPTEEVPVNSRPFKVSGQSSPSGIQAKKNLFNNQGNASPPTGPGNVPRFGAPKPPLGVKPSEDKLDMDHKPSFLKPTPGANQRFGGIANSPNRDPEVKVGFPKPGGPKPINLPKEESKPVLPRLPGNKPPLQSLSQDSDSKPPGLKPRAVPPVQENEQKEGFPKLAGVKGKFMSASQEPDPKPLFPKPPFGQKSTLSSSASHEDESPTKNLSPQRGPPTPLGAKPKPGPLKPAREDPESKDHSGVHSASSPFPGVVLKPAAHRGPPGPLKNAEEKKEERRIDSAKNIFLSKMTQEESAPGATPAKVPKVPSKLTVGGPWAQSQEKDKGDKTPGVPKQKPLPSLLTLGPPPPKPSRPPHVDLTKYRKATTANSTNKGPASYSTTSLPPPPPPHPASQPPLPACHPSQPPVPSLPPRNIKPAIDLKNLASEENQDVSVISDGPGDIEEEQESEGETYEDIEAAKEREKKREKEEKKRLELEKKEQKEKEKKEQEIRKKFKLTGPIQVIHQAKACCDVKGAKNELSCKQGEQIEIIRLTDNPEGKWLGRTAKGSYGYIKTTSVEIDYDSLQRKKNSLCAQSSRPVDDDQEVYDDVAEQADVGSHSQSGSGGTCPAPSNDDIYDGIEEEDAGEDSLLQMEEKSNTWSWGILKMLKGKDDKKKSVREKSKVSDSDNDEGSPFPPPPEQLDVGEEVYDDVDASDYPAPSAKISQGVNTGKAKAEEKDLKKLKKQEKEEKDFRKKFKYDGEIRVLYSTNVLSSLTCKKWGARDLQVKAGESLEVIQNTDDMKVLCRNEEGKYGYVLRSYLEDT